MIQQEQIRGKIQGRYGNLNQSIQYIKKAIQKKQRSKKYLTTLEFYGQEMVRELEEATRLKREIQRIEQQIQTFH